MYSFDILLYSTLFLFFFFHRWFKLIQRQVERRIGEGAIIINTHISKALHPRMADKRILFRIVATLSPAGKRREAHSLSVLAERSSGLANGYDSAFKREGERVESHSFSFPRGTISVRPYRCFPDTGRTMEKEGEGEREREIVKDGITSIRRITCINNYYGAEQLL